jgi:hypothetical protein
LEHKPKARPGTKETTVPELLSLRLLVTLSNLKEKYAPTFEVEDKPSIDEWLCLMQRDPLQRQRMGSSKTQDYVMFYLMYEDDEWLPLTKDSACLEYVNISRHPARERRTVCAALGEV